MIIGDGDDPDHRRVFDMVDAATDTEFKELSQAQMDWHAEFANVVQAKMQKDIAVQTALNGRNAARAARAALLASGTPLSVVSAVLPSYIGYAVIDEDGNACHYEVDGRGWDKRKLITAAFRRFAAAAARALFMGTTLDLQAQKVVNELVRQDFMRENGKLFDKAAPTYSHTGSTTGLAVGGHNMDRDLEILVRLPGLRRISVVETFLGMQAWSDSKVLSLSLFATPGVVWCSYEALLAAIKTWVAFAMFCFGPHMVVLETMLLEVVTNPSVVDLCADHPLYLAHLVEYKLRCLWTVMRTQLIVEGKVVKLGDMGWTDFFEKSLKEIVVSEDHINRFNRKGKSGLSALFLDPTVVSKGGNLSTRVTRSSSLEEDDVQDTALEKKSRGSGPSVKSSSSSTGRQGTPRPSKDSALGTKTITSGGSGDKVESSKKARVTPEGLYWQESDGPHYGNQRITGRPRPTNTSNLCIRYAAECLGLADFPRCVVDNCRFGHKTPNSEREWVGLVESVRLSALSGDLKSSFIDGAYAARRALVTKPSV